MRFKKELQAALLVNLALVAIASPGIAQNAGKADSITVAIAPEYDKVSGFHRFWLGESYRKIWATPVKLRIMDLQKEKGGLTITKLGGGMQTRSLRLKDVSGKEWVLRTVQKYADRSLPENLRATIAKDITQDQVSTNHPFASLIVPTLAGALDLAHAKPEIVYVGDDPGLGEYRKDFANAAYVFEERSPFEEKTDNTEKAQKKILKDNDTHADQKMTLRARLLDFLLGDWDRHEDNWRWSVDKTPDGTTYSPVPRDRDKVFYKTSGVFPWVLTHQWLKSHLQPYSPTIRDVEHWNFNERYFDRFFLNELTEQDWKEQVKVVQSKMTDELIAKSFREMPEPIFKQCGAELIGNFTSRRDQLETLALKYYRFLSINVDVPGSEKTEYFDVKHQENGMVRLHVYNIKKDGTKGRLFFDRTFDPKVTKEIRLFGLGGKDVFDVHGKANSTIKVRMIGGDEEDQFKVAENVSNKSGLFIYDRKDEINQLPEQGFAKLRLAKDTAVNQFNKTGFLYDRSGILFDLNYNIDQGVQIGLGYIIEKQGFRKEPYASKQEIWAHYSTGRKSFILDYAGDFKKAIGNNDLKVTVNMLGPNNLSNFFGLGNNTAYVKDREDDHHEEENDKEDGISYYRNRYNYLNANIKLKRDLDKFWSVEGGLLLSYYASERSENDERFLFDYDLANPGQDVFSNRFYAGLTAGWSYDTRDNIAIPKKGVFWKTTLSAQQRVTGDDQRYGILTSEFRFYLNPGKSGLVIANRIGGGTTVGNPAFFQNIQLGGVNSLRGFNSRRFTGRTGAYHNLDLRLKLFNFTSYLVPGTVGMIGFNDVGRVWQPGESSGRWHHGYGGGLYIMPGDQILIQGTVGFSKEATMPYFSVGFNF
ncbi:hypothetical protein DBR43_01500 [Pedobacter sp. KBW06]|uniref:BamA/TamA family outer membrane protein n=1 Tax=Pedobacter sp. KBW06 TaxID=2153359 RepID=UPI000F5A1B74|nr:BamA/TamA family outer membrane protein [Pedobacter sp. KBW06]RQO74107.1 hypothetical protein DBR43_01500 [Pedobacter sp. KBW06]